jgi:hypothetical protein
MRKKMGDKELNRESAQIFQQPKDMIFVFGISEELRTTEPGTMNNYT